MRLNIILFVLIGLLTLASHGSATSAAEAGTIKGTVRATSGGQSAIIVGARLTLINKATPNLPYSAVSNDAGEFGVSGQRGAQDRNEARRHFGRLDQRRRSRRECRYRVDQAEQQREIPWRDDAH